MSRTKRGPWTSYKQRLRNSHSRKDRSRPKPRLSPLPVSRPRLYRYSRPFVDAVEDGSLHSASDGGLTRGALRLFVVTAAGSSSGVSSSLSSSSSFSFPFCLKHLTISRCQLVSSTMIPSRIHQSKILIQSSLPASLIRRFSQSASSGYPSEISLNSMIMLV